MIPFMKIENESEAMIASFDLVARQGETEKAVVALRSEVDEVIARLDRIEFAASRPVLGRDRKDKVEVKSFVDGYLRRGSTSQVKSVAACVAREGGYAVPREIGA